jgi:amino acid transporter
VASVRLARRTLTTIVALPVFMLGGVALLVRAYGITATVPGQAGYESVISQVVAAVAGRGAFYYVTMAAVLTGLALSANTSFAGFPRVCRVLAGEHYLPPEMARRGSRLVFTSGIVLLALLAGLLLVIFGGVTDHLIPLFAVGALLAFTMSQFGMVAHWRRSTEPRRSVKLIINAVGGVATSIALLIVVVSKFTHGAYQRLVRWLHHLTATEPDRHVVVLLPELVHRRWYQFVVTYRTMRLKAELLMNGGPHVSVMTTPWYPDLRPADVQSRWWFRRFHKPHTEDA